MEAVLRPPNLNCSPLILPTRASPSPTYSKHSFYPIRLNHSRPFITASSSSSVGNPRSVLKAVLTRKRDSRNEDELFPFIVDPSPKPNLSIRTAFVQGLQVSSLFALFAYVMLRPPKYAFALTRQGSVVNFIALKSWLSVAVVSGFMFCCNTLPHYFPVTISSVATSWLGVATSCLALYGPVKSVVNPVISYIHRPPSNPDKILAFFGSSIPWLLPIIEKRMCVVISAISFVSWGYAYQVTKPGELKTFYPLFGLGLDVFLILFGRKVKLFSVSKNSFGQEVDGSAIILFGTISIVALLGPAIVAWWANSREPPSTPTKKKVAKTRVPAERKKTKKHEAAQRRPRRNKCREQINDKTKPRQRNRIGVQITEIEVEIEKI